MDHMTDMMHMEKGFWGLIYESTNWWQLGQVETSWEIKLKPFWPLSLKETGWESSKWTLEELSLLGTNHTNPSKTYAQAPLQASAWSSKKEQRWCTPAMEETGVVRNPWHRPVMIFCRREQSPKNCFDNPWPIWPISWNYWISLQRRAETLSSFPLRMLGLEDLGGFIESNLC